MLTLSKNPAIVYLLYCLKKGTALLIILASMFTPACHRDQPQVYSSASAAIPVFGDHIDYKEPASFQYFTNTVDTFLQYHFSKENKTPIRFRFSPFELNKVWIECYYSGSMELDLGTGQLISLAQKFNHPFFEKQLHTQNIFPDSFHSTSCWFIDYQQGAICYDFADKTLQYFSLNAFAGSRPSILLFDSEHVWIGTDQGLWVYERKSRSIYLVENSPKEFISQLKIDKNGKIYAGQYVYNPNAGCWEVPINFFDQYTVKPDPIYQYDEFTLFAYNHGATLYVRRPDGQVLSTPEYLHGQYPNGKSFVFPYSGAIFHGTLSVEFPYFWCNSTDEIGLFDIQTLKLRYQHLGLPRVNGTFDYSIAFAPEEIWYCNNYYWFALRKKDGVIHIYRPPVPDHPAFMQVDGKYVYLLTQKGFSIWNKKYLAKAHPGDPALFEKIQRFQFMMDSLSFYGTGDWQERLQKIAFVKRAFKEETDRYILQNIQAWEASVSPASEEELRKLLQYRDLQPSTIASAYRSVIGSVVPSGNLRLGLRLYREFEAKHLPVEEQSYHNNRIIILDTTLQRLDSIDRSPLKADEKFWMKGQIMQNFCINFGLEGAASCYDFSLSDSIYRQLIKKFPTSSLADDAEYKLNLNCFCHEGSDGSDSPEEVIMWNGFIRKYPESEWVPYALANMAWALGRSPKDLQKGLTWLQQARALRPDLFVGTEPRGELYYTWSEFSSQMQYNDLQLSATLLEDTVSTNDPVILSFTLKNTGAVPIDLYGIFRESIPNFIVQISLETPNPACVRPVGFEGDVRNAMLNNASLYSNKTLAPGQSYTEKWDLTVLARREAGNTRLGRFVFDQPGNYTVEAWTHLFPNPYWGTKGAEKMQLVVR